VRARLGRIDLPHYACIVQEGQTAAGRQAELADGLRRIGRDLLGDPEDGVEIAWILVREGFGFTAGEPSTASLVVRSVPKGFPDERRETFMSLVCDLWTSTTGCTATEIMVTAMDGPLPL
jgi:hypothetical protein